MASDSAIMQAERVWKTKLCSWGTSQAVRIPREVCDEAGLAPGDELDMATYRDANGLNVVIRSANGTHRNFVAAPRVSLRDIFSNYQGEYRGDELDWGKDVGAEIVP